MYHQISKWFHPTIISIYHTYILLYVVNIASLSASIVEAINEIWMDFNETSDYTNALNAILNAPLMV